MGGNEYFFKNMVASESATVSDSGNNHIDPESLKRWEDEEILDSIRHLFITGEDIDRLIAEGRDGEQDTKDDEDDVSDADSSILQAPKPQTSSDPTSRAAALLAKEEALKRRVGA